MILFRVVNLMDIMSYAYNETKSLVPGNSCFIVNRYMGNAVLYFFFVGISGPGQPWVKVMEVGVSGGHGTSVHLLPQSVL